MMRLMHPSERVHPYDVAGCDRPAAWTAEDCHYCHDHWTPEPFGCGRYPACGCEGICQYWNGPTLEPMPNPTCEGMGDYLTDD